jgi:hypothetical protein
MRGKDLRNEKSNMHCITLPHLDRRIDVHE